MSATWRVVYTYRYEVVIMTERARRVIARLNMILSGCWFSHDNLIRVRDKHGVLHYKCERCGHLGVWYGTEAITTRTHSEH